MNSIYEDADKKIWVTLWERGLHRYDSKKDTFVAMPQIGTLNNPFRVFQDDKKQHWYWLGKVEFFCLILKKNRI